MAEFTLATGLAIVIGFTQAVKVTFPKTKQYAPIIAIVLGLGIGLLFVPDTRQAILAGLLMGLSASGLYSGVKSFIVK